MNKIKEFFDDSPNLKIFLTGLSFISAALWILITLLWTFTETESFFDELGAAFVTSLVVYLIVGLVGIGAAIWSEITG